ncbi:glycoside hydrolase superfamily [Ampelomyces quisqualis]|uniref:Glycoside hydrolase superfamily n=1 Tax=Ampelomyces quisqualis TaxID=50730 RepID=A0A6A5QB55_AMPQU|nr:glycoside hydrolase superfamily [Ampelomyces quisqualis]
MASAAPKFLSPENGPRLIVYHQTIHDPQGNPHSLLPLLTNNTGITHVIVAAIHLNAEPGNITLNDHRPDDKRFDQLWGEVAWLQGSGVKVLGMLGGAAKGSFAQLSGDDHSFEAHYTPLHALLRTHKLNGLDLDVEEETSLHTMTRLIARLRADFGTPFIITLAPVATALLPDPSRHLSGFSYAALEGALGADIAWYNTQFYCGWGDARSTAWYDAIVRAGWAPEKIVLGVVTSPANGAGFVDAQRLRDTCARLRARYRGVGRGFGGVMGWEYFNAGEGDRVAGLESGRSVQAGWVAALGRVLRLHEQEDALLPTPEHVRQMVTTLPRPHVPWPDDAVQKLVVLGFAPHQAVAALNATAGDLELAAGFLFDHVLP